MNKVIMGFVFTVLSIISVCTYAQTQDICVANTSQFENAIVVASSPVAHIVADKYIIRVQQGIYDLSNTSVLSVNDGFQRLYLRTDVEILGGYTAGCNSRVLDANNTRMWNSNTAVHLGLWPFKDFKLEGFHFENFRNKMDFDPFTVDPKSQTIIFSHLRFSNGSGEINMGAEAGSGASLLELRNVEVWNRTLSSSADCALDISGDTDDSHQVSLHLINNTVANSQVGKGICISNIGTPKTYNSIYWGSAGINFDRVAASSTGDVHAYHNVFGSNTIGGFAVNVSNNGNDPLFVNAAGGNLRLATGSPALNSGYISVPYGPGAVDVVGNTRVQGLAIDRGAYESLDTGLFLLSVTNTNDSGGGSLRNAIDQANSTPGPNGIVFNIGGATCPKVINLNSVLPAITESVVIDASSQPGYVANTLNYGYNGTRCVVLQAAIGTPITWGLSVLSPATAGTRLVVDSMAFGGFSIAGIYMGAGANHAIRGNQFGGNVGSHSMIANGRGVMVVNVPDVLIGGYPLNDRNDIGSSIGAGIEVTGATANGAQVINNWIGLTPQGAGYGNQVGIRINADLGEYKYNLVSFNTAEGFSLSSAADDNWLFDNRIGLSPFCLLPPCSSAGNDMGILVEGTYNRINKNAISNNTTGGIRVTGNDNSVIENTAYLNGNVLQVPIDIGEVGFSAHRNNNEASPPAGNRSINYPQIESVVQTANEHQVNGTLNGKNGKYRIVVYAGSRRLGGLNPNRCEGRIHIKTATVNIINAPAGNNGSASFTVYIANDEMPSTSLPFLTATATIETTYNGGQRYGDSSEYGNCVDRPLFSNGFE